MSDDRRLYSKRIEHPHFEALVYVMTNEFDEDEDCDCAVAVIHAWVLPDYTSINVSLGFRHDDEGPEDAAERAFRVLDDSDADSVEAMLRNNPIMEGILNKLPATE